jgi:hypothetical protein
MDHSSTYSVSGRSLATIIDACDGGKSPWSKAELGAILDHQLSSPLADDLLACDPGTPAYLKVPDIATFRDLFLNARPPIELLELAKRFAKRGRDDPQDLVPKEVSTVLYFLSVAVALARWGQRISRLNDEALREGIEWALAQPWLDDDTRRLLSEGLEGLSEAGNNKSPLPPGEG